MRSGTTSLHNFLARHPDVVVARSRKEVHYFDQHYARGPGWYEGLYPQGGLWRADVTPNYMYDPEVAGRIRGSGAAAVAMLRDPVDRAYSHYLQKWSYGSELLSFSDALDAEPQRI